MKKINFLLFLLLFIGIGTTKAQYDTLVNFKGKNGMSPYGSLMLSGNKLYGMTPQGGANGFGCVFSIDTTGVNYKILYSFNSATEGSPYGSFILLGKKLYALQSMGGGPGYGDIISIDTDGTNITNYRSLYGVSGSQPYGSLTYSAGKIYGMASGGGLNGDGNIFSMDTNGANFNSLFSFSGPDGNYPTGSLTLVGNKLYGMTPNGGVNDSGVIFSIDTDGTGYRVLFYGTLKNGYHPAGSLIYFGNKLYGMTLRGGTNDEGVIFSIDTNGANETVLSSFKGSNGKYPGNYTSLVGSGKTLYGMIGEGGASGQGLIFAVDTNGANFTYLFGFTAGTGNNATGSLTVVGNKLFGMTNSGGQNNDGVIFEYHTNICTNNYNEPICMVTLDTATNHNEVIWGRTNSPTNPKNSFYNVYRDTGTGYLVIGSVPLDSLSEFEVIDSSSGPPHGAVSYKLSTVDSCGESALSAPHTSIYLTTTAALNVNILNWTAYSGFTPSEYRIFRGPNMHSLVQIDSVANTVLTYHDTLPPVGSVYMVEAVNPSGPCIPTHKPYKGLSALSGSFSNGFNTAILTSIKAVNSMVNNIAVYPNPANQLLNIKFSNSKEYSAQMNITDVTGRTIMTVANKEILNGTCALNIADLGSGIYFIRIITESSSQVIRFVKE